MHQMGHLSLRRALVGPLYASRLPTDRAAARGATCEAHRISSRNQGNEVAGILWHTTRWRSTSVVPSLT